MIRRYRRPDGLFYHERAEATGEDMEPTLKEYLSKVGKADPVLNWWQAEGERVLQEKGYPVEWESLSSMLLEGEHSREIHDIAAMLFRLNLVRKAISKKQIDEAVWNTALAVQHGLKARIRPFEPDVLRGVKYSQTQAGNQGKRQTWKGLTREQREARNNLILAAYEQTKLTLHGFATRQAKKHNLKTTSIKKILKKSTTAS